MRKPGSRRFWVGLILTLTAPAAMVSTAHAANLNLGDEFYSGEAGILLSEGVERPKGLTTESVSGKLLGERRLLVPSKSAEIVCSEAEVTEGFAANEYENYKTGTMQKGGYGFGAGLLKGCRVFQINPTTGVLEVELKKCTEELDKGTSPVGQHHITLKGSGFLKRHEGKTYGISEGFINSKATAEQAEALTLPYATVTFGGTCSLPEKVTLTGSVAGEAPLKDAIKPIQSVDTFSKAGKELQALLGARLKFGANEAFISGEGQAELTGSGAGLSWGAM